MSFFQNASTSLKLVSLPWLIFILNIYLPVDVRIYGIRPRETEGLWGIAFAPFLHANFSHLVANTSALFFLLLISLNYSRKLTYKALLAIAFIGGCLLWAFGSGHSIHIGASGIIFGLIGYLLFLGIYRRDWKAIIVSAIVVFFYGGMLLSLLVQTPGISWAGHFFGFVAGIMAASRSRKADT